MTVFAIRVKKRDHDSLDAVVRRSKHASLPKVGDTLHLKADTVSALEGASQTFRPTSPITKVYIIDQISSLIVDDVRVPLFSVELA